MKKIYLAPQAKLIVINIRYTLMAGSIPNVRLGSDSVDADDLDARQSDYFQHNSVWDE